MPAIDFTKSIIITNLGLESSLNWSGLSASSSSVLQQVARTTIKAAARVLTLKLPVEWKRQSAAAVAVASSLAVLIRDGFGG